MRPINLPASELKALEHECQRCASPPGTAGPGSAAAERCSGSAAGSSAGGSGQLRRTAMREKEAMREKGGAEKVRLRDRD